ncbi:MAG: flagellar type III secretion system protein FlhB [Pseudomonadota bacterium]
MSDQNQTSQEKTHEATPQKLERARKKGEIARSMDVQTFAAYLGFISAIFLAGAWSASRVGETLMTFLARPQELADLHLSASSDIFADISLRVIGAVSPILAAPAVLIVLLLISQKAIILAPEKLQPKLSRISPVSNAKQKYGPHGLMEFAKSAVKLTAVAGVLAIAVLAELDRLPSYVRLQPGFIPELLSRQFWNIATGVLILAFSIAVLDFLWQRHSHLKKMRMTHQEVKDETKQSEGDPHMRASRRDRAREIASNRMLHDVPNADVVIVNPTHFAVALKWSRLPNTVPVCIAKGEDELARRIRLRAEQAEVPIHQDAPTARSVFAMVEVGHPIEPDHYKAVAAAIVFADKLRAQRCERTGGAA